VLVVTQDVFAVLGTVRLFIDGLLVIFCLFAGVLDVLHVLLLELGKVLGVGKV